MYTLVLVAALILLTLPNVSLAQTSRDHAVLVSMERVLGQFGVTWPRDTLPTTYYIRVRSLDNQDWIPYDTLTNESANLYIIPPSLDHAEVEVEKRTVDADGKAITAFGYYLGHGAGNYARWQRPGRVLLVVDEEAAGVLAQQIATWTDDAQREGWVVQTHVVLTARRTDVGFLQRSIADAFHNTSADAPLTHVFILGDVPYAYSGGFTRSGPIVQPDGHGEHGGAWSSDARYADVETSPGVSSDEQWTDETVNITDDARANREQNKNRPADGKYDQSQIPTDVELCIGRVDMRNLPAFGTTSDDRTREIDLMRQYLDRAHSYRTKQMQFDTTARIDDNFGVFASENDSVRLVAAFAASAWRGFSAIVGRDRVMNGQFLDTIPTLLAYGCGGGGYDHCDGVANTTEFAANPIRSSFVWLFGSYFADVDSDNNIMRAALANDGNVLTCAWSGRPYWVLHPLAAMHTIGEVTRASINNAGIYRSATIYSKTTGEAFDYAYGQRGIHINLLGDPTLRMPAPAMTGALSIAEIGDSTRFEWDGINDALTFLIEAGPSLDKPLNLVASKATSKYTPRVSATIVLPPASRYVRVRPIFGTLDESSFTPILGRGLIGFRDVTDVQQEGAARFAAQGTAHYFDGAIVIKGAPFGPLQASMFDLMGREVCDLTFVNAGTDLRATAPSTIPRGVYFVRKFEAGFGIEMSLLHYTIYIP